MMQFVQDDSGSFKLVQILADPLATTGTNVMHNRYQCYASFYNADVATRDRRIGSGDQFFYIKVGFAETSSLARICLCRRHL
jgi:hypothetical protein